VRPADGVSGVPETRLWSVSAANGRSPGVVARLPDLHPEVVGGEDRAADMVGADVVDLALFSQWKPPTPTYNF
ncbi:MAG: hypothetical protein WBC68_09000, partial [Albidovulum sp.]